MRLFAALRPDPAFREALETAQEALRRRCRKGSFPPPSSFHLTLAFLGETNRLENACRALARLEGAPLLLEGAELGRFSRREGELWWAAVKPDPALLALHKELAALLEEEGFSLKERSFLPHITLARRCRTMDPPPERELLPPVSWRAGEVVLFQSVLGQGGPCYQPLMIKQLEEPCHG